MAEDNKTTLFDEYKERVKVIRGIDVGPGGTFEIFCDLVEEKISALKSKEKYSCYGNHPGAFSGIKCSLPCSFKEGCLIETVHKDLN